MDNAKQFATILDDQGGLLTHKKKPAAKTPQKGKGTKATPKRKPLKVVSGNKEQIKEQKKSAPAAPRKLRFTANLSPEIISRARAASYWVPGLTVSMLVERALEKEIKALENEHNEGKAFKEAGPLKLGRPIKD